MFRPALLHALCASALVIASAAAAATWKAKKFGDANGWTVNSMSVEGQFMNCEALAPAAPAALSRSSEGWVLKAPSTSKGDEVKGAFEVDGKAVKATFNRFDDGKYGVFLKSAQLKMLQAGKVLSVKIGADETKLSIERLTAVVRKVQQCEDKGG
ncbi:MAG: hypothetical protein KDJ44_12655 [Rhodoblastus sp.]|nr:hypothetical protein [Rhodoblastus sp.]